MTISASKQHQFQMLALQHTEFMMKLYTQ